MSIFYHSSAWNKHSNKVGAALLDNWVEERAVGVAEPLGATLNKNGHANLLVHPNPHAMRESNISQAMDTYRAPVSAKREMGKRASMMREINIEKAGRVEKPAVEKEEYGTSSTYGNFPGAAPVRILGTAHISAAERAEFDQPITYFSKGNPGGASDGQAILYTH